MLYHVIVGCLLEIYVDIYVISCIQYCSFYSVHPSSLSAEVGVRHRRNPSCLLYVAFLGWGKIFKADFADMYSGNISACISGGKASMRRQGARTPMQVGEIIIETVCDKYFLYLYLFSQIYVNIWITQIMHIQTWLIYYANLVCCCLFRLVFSSYFL